MAQTVAIGTLKAGQWFEWSGSVGMVRQNDDHCLFACCFWVRNPEDYTPRQVFQRYVEVTPLDAAQVDRALLEAAARVTGGPMPAISRTGFPHAAYWRQESARLDRERMPLEVAAGFDSSQVADWALEDHRRNERTFLFVMGLIIGAAAGALLMLAIVQAAA